MKTTAKWAWIAALLLAAMACNLPRGAGPTPSPTVTQTPGAAARATLKAMESTATAAQKQSAALAKTGTAAAQAGETVSPTTAPPTTAPTTQAPIPVTPPDVTLPPPLTATATPFEYVLVESFTAAPELIDPGDDITLSWETVGDAATLCTTMPTGQLSTCWDVPLVGSQVVSTRDSVRNWVVYVLFAIKGDLTEAATVSVEVRCPDTWFFANPPDACPGAPAVISDGAAQYFEHGLMIWVEALDMIFVMYDGGDSKPWRQTPDPWEPGLPDSDPELVPPEGFYQPVRGFGMVWRNPDGMVYTTREWLGWALGQEFAMEAGYQCDSAPKYVFCYLRGPEGVIVLEPYGSKWHPWTGVGD
jgi:hypothetical protein